MKSFFDRTLGVTFLSVVLYLLAIPAVFCWEVNLWPLVFFVPAIWARLVRSETFMQSRFRYTKVYLCSLIFWLTTTFWVCFPHPLTSLGWIALSTYLACYLPIFIAVSRRLTRRHSLPIWLVCPIVWVCVEWLRNHVFGGMSLAALEHSFYKVPLLIQTADLGGQYLVGAEIVLIGCWLEQTQTMIANKKRVLTVGLCAKLLVVLTILVYGEMKKSSPQGEPLRIAITQGNYPVMLDPPEGWWEKTYKQYCDLTDAVVKQAAGEGKPLDLIIWPETVFPYPLVEFGEGFVPDQWKDSDLTPEEIQEGLAKEIAESQKVPLAMASQWNTPLLLGATMYSLKPKGEETQQDRFNSAILVDPKTQTVGPRYDKVHLVMFGEYVPFTEYLPDDFPLKTLCQTASRGTKPVAIPIPGPEDREPVYLSANICFEGLIPHLIRRQVVELRQQGKEPSLLVNLSNVGWFYFTSETDLQFAAQIFRAVENRKPYITAANGGFSAYVDSYGNITQQGKRREATSFIAEVTIFLNGSVYTAIGDLFACLCLLFTAGLLLQSGAVVQYLSFKQRAGDEA